MKTAKEKIDNLLKSFSIKQLYFAAVLPLLILGYILIAFSVWNVYLHQMKNTLALETQNAIMNKTDNFNGYFDSLLLCNRLHHLFRYYPTAPSKERYSPISG